VFDRGGGDQHIDVSDQPWTIWWAQTTPDIRIPFKNGVVGK
jgi:hypothetical protein